MSSDSWCTIESDPGVFTELLEEIGVGGVELQELWSLDDLFSTHSDTVMYGLIFLFQWNGKDYSSPRKVMIEPPEGLFFAHQVVPNACATQALLSIVMNVPSLELGPTLSDFRSFTASFPPELKGESIGASVNIQRVHNSFARKDAFLMDGRHVAADDDDAAAAYHFVAYLPYQGNVYELDGLQRGPIQLGPMVDGDWKSVASAAIQTRMTAASNVHFNLMAVVQDQRLILQQQLELLDTDSSEHVAVSMQLEGQRVKREQWKTENQRRKHNYVPLCIQLIKELARKGELPTLVSEAQERLRIKRLKKSSEANGALK